MSAENLEPRETDESNWGSVLEAEVAENLPAVRQPQELTVAPEPESTALDMTPYVGVSAVPFDKAVQDTLLKYQTVPDTWIDIKPNGQIYLSHTRARSILNEAFGFGGWGCVPVGDFKVERNGNHVTLYRTWRFYAHGRFVRECMSAGDYYTNNANTNYADAAEACESYAVNRFAKFLGIAMNCWDKDYSEAWKQKYAKGGKKQPNPVALTGQTDAGSHPATTPTQPNATPATKPATTVAPASVPSADHGVVEGPVTRIAALKKGARVEVAGQGFSTFSVTDLKTAEDAQQNGTIVRLTWKTSSDGKWKNVVSIEAI